MTEPLQTETDKEKDILLKSKLFRGLDQKPIIYGLNKLIIDGSASGIPNEIVRRNAMNIFGYELSNEFIDETIKKNTTEIEQRKQEINTDIEKMGFASIASDIIHELRAKAVETDNTKEYVALLTTLKQYLEFFIARKDNILKQTQINIGTMNVQHNDYKVIKILEEEGVIKVIDEERMKMLFDIGKEKKETESTNTTEDKDGTES